MNRQQRRRLIASNPGARALLLTCGLALAAIGVRATQPSTHRAVATSTPTTTAALINQLDAVDTSNPYYSDKEHAWCVEQLLDSGTQIRICAPAASDFTPRGLVGVTICTRSMEDEIIAENADGTPSIGQEIEVYRCL